MHYTATGTIYGVLIQCLHNDLARAFQYITLEGQVLLVNGNVTDKARTVSYS